MRSNKARSFLFALAILGLSVVAHGQTPTIDQSLDLKSASGPRISRSPSRHQHGAHQGSIAGDFAGWTEDCLRGRVGGPGSVVAAVVGFTVGSRVAGNRARIDAVLVSGRPVHWLFRG